MDDEIDFQVAGGGPVSGVDPRANLLKIDSLESPKRTRAGLAIASGKEMQRRTAAIGRHTGSACAGTIEAHRNRISDERH